MLRNFFVEIVALTILALLLFAAMCWAKPAPKTVPTGPPNFDGMKCQFGDITQKGRRISIAGSYWTAEGEIRDGYLFCEWRSLNSDRAALGLYKLGEEQLIGHFGYDAFYTGPPWDICSEQGVSAETLVISGREKAKEPEAGPVQ